MLQLEEKRSTAKHPDAKAQLLLKEYARSNKKASPIFKDMGETDASVPELPEYAVSCIFQGFEAIGRGVDKSEARSDAAERILNMIKKKSESVAKRTPQKKENKASARVNVTKKTGVRRHKKQGGAKG